MIDPKVTWPSEQEPISEGEMEKLTAAKVSKTFDSDSLEGKALELYVGQMVEKYATDQPRGPDGKWVGHASDAVGPGKVSTNPPAIANPYIVPSGNAKPASDAPAAEHAQFHAKEMIHWLKQQVTAYQAGHDTHGDEIQHLVSSHSTQYSHYSGIHSLHTDKNLGAPSEFNEFDQEIAKLQEEIATIQTNVADGQAAVQKKLYCEFVQKNETADKQLVTGIVLVPEVVDAQGDIYDASVIEDAAHKFLAKYNAGTKMGMMHKQFHQMIDLVESYVAPSDFNLNGREISKGTWLMTVKVKDPTLWMKVKNGELTGFSIGGIAKVMKLGN